MDVKFLDMFIAVTQKNLTSISLEALLSLSDVSIAEQKLTRASWQIRDNNKLEIYKKWVEHSKHILKVEGNLSIGILLVKLLQESDLNLNYISACEALSEVFNYFLSNEENILGLSNLIRNFVDSPIAFAAFIRYLCIREIDVDKILETYLLHDYLHYYIYTLSYKNNEVKQLFALLENFPESKNLAEAARQVQCSERGFNSYTLDGVADKQELIIIKKKISEENITVTEENLNKLYKLFGTPLLIQLISRWVTFKSDNEYLTFLGNILNDDKFIQTKLPSILIDQIESEIAHQALATLLSKQTLITLIANKNHAILALVTYRQELLEIIEKEHLESYLQITNKQDIYKFTLVSGLIKLIDILSRQKSLHIELLIKYLINTALEIPEVFEDEGVLRVIRKFSFSLVYCENIIHNFESNLDLIIDQNLKNNFIGFDIISIEDTWRESYKKVQALNDVIQIANRIPEDKILLYVYIAKKINNRYGFIEIAKFAELFNIAPEFSDDVSIYERFIINLLTSIDDSEVRKKSIDLLATQALHPWQDYYGHYDLYGNAVRSGNLGLIIWFKDHGFTPRESISALMITAANLNHWHEVDYFNKEFSIKKSISNTLLHIMIKNEAGEAIEMIWKSGLNLPNLKQIEKSLKLAITKNDKLSVHNILNFLELPNDDKLASVFKIAIQEESYDCAKLIAECKTPKTKKLISAIEDAIIYGSNKNKCELLQKLINECKPQIISKALLLAVRANSEYAVKILLTSTNKRLCPKLVNKAHAHAQKKGYELISSYISEYLADSNTSKISIILPTNTPKSPISKLSIFASKASNDNKHYQSSGTLSIFSNQMSPKTNKKIRGTLSPIALTRAISI